jgi:hypothetical protein
LIERNRTALERHGIICTTVVQLNGKPGPIYRLALRIDQFADPARVTVLDVDALTRLEQGWQTE